MSEGIDGDFERRFRSQGEVSYEPGWRPQRSRDRTWVNGALFLFTVYTTTFAGMWMSPALRGLDAGADGWSILLNPKYLVYGLPFSFALLAILGVHEMGHYIASRRWNVRATLPYFIPFPSMIGTLGAVIKIRSRIPNRRALIDIGASGPLGDSLLSAWLSGLIIGELPAGADVYLHPVAFAGWLGLLVTVLNLLPIGQFDGGHIVYAIFGRRQELISKAAILGLGLFWALGPPYGWLHAESVLSEWIASRWPGWLIWLFLAIVLGRRHPAPDDPYLELDRGRKVVGYLSLAIFVLCFIPRPISLSSP